MIQSPFFLVLDVGTTGVKAIAFDKQLAQLARISETLTLRHPKRGWVEQNPQELLKRSLTVLHNAVKHGHLDVRDCLGIGIANQRETTILWDARTGKPVYPAIVWQDSRTQRWCDAFTKKQRAFVQQQTGLTIAPYFSASKTHWMLDHVPSTRILLEQHRLRFGTVDSWLLWNLTDDHQHLTDETNAARTLLCNIHTHSWDNELLRLFDIPSSILPRILPSRAAFGRLSERILGRSIPILAVCGDQQASFYAALHATSDRSTKVTKVTYGTGTFITQSLPSFQLQQNFSTTIAPHPRGRTFILEAKIQRGGRELESLLAHPKKRDAFLRRLALDADQLIRQLPTPPKTLFIDGGVTRDGLMTIIQRDISGIRIQPLSSFDGTALGIAALCQDSLS